MKQSLPPPLPVDDVQFTAKIDFVTFTNEGVKIPLPPLQGAHEWVRAKGSSSWVLTIHDPTVADLRTIETAYENPRVLAIEVAVDAAPKKVGSSARHTERLETLFVAIAARFRPEDKALWDYGIRGALSRRGQRPEPLERRFARPDEEVIFGRRGDFMQAKLYLKTLDHGVLLPPSDQRVRMEVTVRNSGCYDFGIHRAADLFGYPYRAKFATQFRIVDRPEVRMQRGLTAEEIDRRTKRMWRAWATAGVGKFAVAEAPRAAVFPADVARVRSRARAQLPADEFKLMRDQKANAKIGAALVGLQRRMKGR